MSGQDLPEGMTPVDEVEDEDNDLFFAEQPPNGAGGSGSDKLELIGEFLPGGDEWAAKTNISADQVAALAVVSMLPTLDPEFSEEDQQLASEFVENYLKLTTSKDGEARQEYVDVLQALAGGSRGGADDADGPGIIMQGFGAEADDDE